MSLTFFVEMSSRIPAIHRTGLGFHFILKYLLLLNYLFGADVMMTRFLWFQLKKLRHVKGAF